MLKNDRYTYRITWSEDDHEYAGLCIEFPSLSWLDEDGAWQDAVTVSHTDIKGGDFASIVRLAPSERPKLDATGAITVRLRVSRVGLNDRSSAELKLPLGRITNPSTSNALTFAWNDLLP